MTKMANIEEIRPSNLPAAAVDLMQTAWENHSWPGKPIELTTIKGRISYILRTWAESISNSGRPCQNNNTTKPAEVKHD